jgi:uncharacterized membrane protein YfcA
MFFVLIVAAFLAAAISGTAGFGGALLFLPVLTVTVGPVEAVPLLTVAQLIGNASRAALGRRHIRWVPVAAFLATALPCGFVGSLLFIRRPDRDITRSIGVALVVFATLKWFDVLQVPKRTWAVLAGGAVVGFLSGYLGSAGPLGAAVFHSLDLSPLAYVASEAFTALSLHALKTGVYQRHLALGAEFWMTSAAVGIAMVAGTLAGRLVIEHMAVEAFRRSVTILLGVIGLGMLLGM